MADSSKSNDLDGKQKPSVPAWKLRETLREKKGGTPKKNNSMSSTDSLHSLGMSNKKEVDPNLPPAFRVVFEQRKAFKRQQERRKNNDEFVSLNSSHPDKLPSALGEDDSTSSLDDSFASMGEDILEGDEDNDQQE